MAVTPEEELFEERYNDRLYFQRPHFVFPPPGPGTFRGLNMTVTPEEDRYNNWI